MRTCGEKAEFGTITSGHEHFYAWKDIWPESRRDYTPPLGIEREQERMIHGLFAPDKHGFDTKFEDLFRHRTDEEIAAIKKKYGASGDILEAEQRIAAIARDLVAHYINNILPDGFKAQVVCHSKLAAIQRGMS